MYKIWYTLGGRFLWWHRYESQQEAQRFIDSFRNDGNDEGKRTAEHLEVRQVVSAIPASTFRAE